MLTVTNTTEANPAGNPTYLRQAAVLKGNVTYFFPFIATQRTAYVADTTDGAPIDSATRTASLCFMRGLKETGVIETNSGASWMWRRICFTYKGDQMFRDQRTSAYRTSFLQADGRGYGRIVNSVLGPGTLGAITTNLFEGGNDRDWKDPFSAKVDTSLVTLYSDKTTIIRSGNASGTIRRYKHWYPMNKNLQYDDDQDGSVNATSELSATGKAGMGDYVVFDIVRAGGNAVEGDQLLWAPEATLYWHER